MKRIVLAVLVILTLSVSVVAAAGLEVEIRAVPYQFQKYIIIATDKTETTVQGFGGQTGVKYVTNVGFTAGVEVGLDCYTYPVEGNYYTDFDGIFLGKVGLATPIDARVGFELDLGAGIDVCSDPDDGLQVYPSAKLNLGLRLKALKNTDGFALTVGIGFKVDWEKDIWLDYSLAPYFGIDYKI